MDELQSDLHPRLDVFDLQGVGPHALRGQEGRGERHRRRPQHENLMGQIGAAPPPPLLDLQVLLQKAAFSWNHQPS